MMLRTLQLPLLEAVRDTLYRYGPNVSVVLPMLPSALAARNGRYWHLFTGYADRQTLTRVNVG